jgi:site-specific DNA-methyltransferase (adenine-specific)
LRMSNIKMYKYDWIWDKKLAWAFMVAKYRPLPVFENIILFSNSKTIYNPQMVEWKTRSKKNKTKKLDDEMTDNFKWLKWNYDWWIYNMYYPKNIIIDYPNTSSPHRIPHTHLHKRMRNCTRLHCWLWNNLSSLQEYQP